MVAPKTDLLYAQEEVSAVVNALRARMVDGNVTADILLNRLHERRWDIVWFATHGTEEGIVLSDGVASPEILVPLIRTSKANLVVFNTCESVETAFAIHNELLTDFVATIREVPDKLAYLTGKTFALHLSTGMSAHKAWLQCKPGRNNTYLFIPGERFSNGNGVIVPTHDREYKDSDSRSLGHIDEELERINALIEGSKRWNIPGILPTIQKLTEDMKEAKESISFIRLTTALMFIINLFTLMAIFYLTMKVLGL